MNHIINPTTRLTVKHLGYITPDGRLLQVLETTFAHPDSPEHGTVKIIELEPIHVTQRNAAAAELMKQAQENLTQSIQLK